LEPQPAGPEALELTADPAPPALAELEALDDPESDELDPLDATLTKGMPPAPPLPEPLVLLVAASQGRSRPTTAAPPRPDPSSLAAGSTVAPVAQPIAERRNNKFNLRGSLRAKSVERVTFHLERASMPHGGGARRAIG
jgi:hypothetical protein